MSKKIFKYSIILLLIILLLLLFNSFRNYSIFSKILDSEKNNYSNYKCDVSDSYHSGNYLTILKNKENLNSLREKLKSVNIEETAKTLDIGEMTLADIISELSKPGRDPREDMPKPVLRSDVLKFEDLTEGMVLTGTVRNVIDFGAFVDIGVKYDGLVHISEMSDSYVKSPSEIVSVGDIVKVKVIKIDQERKKVGLSMKIS